MVSIIIPTYNEQDSIKELVSFLKENINSNEAEVIVSDGGSSDSTLDQARAAGAKGVLSPLKGRAAQMNFGASKAAGDIFYFLHADTYPPETFLKDIEASLSEGYKAGCYRLAFDDNHLLLRFYSWFTRFDIDYFRFGDQSLFIKKSLFFETKGFDDRLIVMEDQDMVKRLKKQVSFKIIPKSVTTSARKYRQVGILKLQIIFTIILILFYLKIPQERLISFYKRLIG